MTQTLEERIAAISKVFKRLPDNFVGSHGFQYRSAKEQYLNENLDYEQMFQIINELQQKNDLLQLDFNAAQEIMGCMNQEVEKLKKQNKSWKEMVDSTNQTNQALCKRLKIEII